MAELLERRAVRCWQSAKGGGSADSVLALAANPSGGAKLGLD